MDNVWGRAVEGIVGPGRRGGGGGVQSEKCIYGIGKIIYEDADRGMGGDGESRIQGTELRYV